MSCPNYQPTTLVAAYLFSEGIGLADLNRMVAHAAPFTHEWGNRRFDDWVFDVKGMTVARAGHLTRNSSSQQAQTMEQRRPARTIIDDAEIFMVYETCAHCDGDGCGDCNFEGTIAVERKISRPKTGVMR